MRNFVDLKDRCDLREVDLEAIVGLAIIAAGAALVADHKKLLFKRVTPFCVSILWFMLRGHLSITIPRLHMLIAWVDQGLEVAHFDHLSFVLAVLYQRSNFHRI